MIERLALQVAFALNSRIFLAIAARSIHHPAVRARDVSVRTSTSAVTNARFGLALSALCVGIFLAHRGHAQIVEAPPHRIEFDVSPALPKCNEYDSFYGIILNFVRVRSIDPTAKRKLGVSIKLLPDGRKQEELSLWNEAGERIDQFAQTYPATEECFKVLYWAAYDSAVLLGKTVSPPPVEPPMSVDKLVQAAEKRDVAKKNPETISTNARSHDEEPRSHRSRQDQTCERVEEPHFRYHASVGFGVTAGLTRMIMPGFRLGFGRVVGPVMIELSGDVLPPMITATWSTTDQRSEETSARAQGYLGGVALCAQKSPLLGCAVVMGGVAGYSFDKPLFDGERYARGRWGGVVTAGLRAGVDVPLRSRWVLRIDTDVALPVYASAVMRSRTTSGEELVAPIWMGHVAIVPSW